LVGLIQLIGEMALNKLVDWVDQVESVDGIIIEIASAALVLRRHLFK
jgi:hypothetical protein